VAWRDVTWCDVTWCIMQPQLNLHVLLPVLFLFLINLMQCRTKTFCCFVVYLWSLGFVIKICAWMKCVRVCDMLHRTASIWKYNSNVTFHSCFPTSRCNIIMSLESRTQMLTHEEVRLSGSRKEELSGHALTQPLHDLACGVGSNIIIA